MLLTTCYVRGCRLVFAHSVLTDERPRAVPLLRRARRCVAKQRSSASSLTASCTLSTITSATPRPSVRQTSLRAAAKEQVVILYSVCLSKSNRTD